MTDTDEAAPPAPPAGARHRSSAVPLAALYAVLVVYASLYPFAGWKLPPALSLPGALLPPWPRWWDGFDVVANLLGYLPLGALACAAMLRSGRRAGFAFVGAVALAALLSYALELAQNGLPRRVPSALDWALNAGGAALGALCAALLQRLGAYDRWQRWRDRWFVGRSAGAIALLAAWPVGLLFPAPVPLAVGQVLPRLRAALDDLASWGDDSAWGAALAGLLGPAAAPAPRMSPPAEAALTLLGLAVPCLLAYTVVRAGWRRIALAAAAAACACAATTLSTSLSFGPSHALAWIAPTTLPALGGALLLALALARVTRRTAAAAGLVAATALAVLVAQAPTDPYFAQSLQSWEQGRFIRFHGVAQWVGWLWPYAVLAHLIARFAARVDGLGGAGPAP